MSDALMQERYLIRSRWDIMAKVLDVAKSPLPKTRIMYGANLSFRQLEKYLEFLLDVGLLTVSEERQSKVKKLFVTTEKGLSFLEAYRTLGEIVGEKKKRS